LFFWAVHRFGPSLAAMVSYLVPVATLVLAFLVLGDRPSAVQLVGAAIILIGVRFVARRSPAPLRGTRAPI
jgi:drug/metabolite transporter (DMT)-like permease